MQTTFHEFDYLIAQEYIKPNTITLADIQPEYSKVKYAVINGSRVQVLTTEHPFIQSSYIKDMYALNDNISAAAINNAESMGYFKAPDLFYDMGITKKPVDVFVQIAEYFKI